MIEENFWMVAGLAIALILLGFAGGWIIRRKRKTANVVAIGRYKRRAAKGQKCSLCKRKDKLQFYTMGSGQIAGVCKECRGTARKNNWDRV